jgi:mRNA-degrading endonuclease RelE of RelBE toxin-antitoxin system
MYEAVFSDEFKKQLRKIKKKDTILYGRLRRKIEVILLDPDRFKHLRNVLRGEQRSKFGPFVLRFRTNEDVVEFISLEHHDKAY